MSEGEVNQRKEEEKIILKNKDCIIIVNDLTFTHCVFLDLKEINIGKNWAKKCDQ